MILATKVSGAGMKRVRDGAPISSTTISEALDGLLQRLQTDYVDLYQLHWPNRGSYHFRQNWNYDPTQQNTAEVREHIHDVLTALQKEVDRGRIRHIGPSNESAWGVQQFLNVAESEGLPRIISIQNEYSLLCRHYDLDLAETSHHEGVNCLAFSPLACGVLSGKYSGGETPAGSRRSINDTLGGRVTDRLWPATDAYLKIAKDAGLDLCQMALAFCLGRPFMGAAIFGSTSMQQLEIALGAADLTLSEDVQSAISKAHRDHPLPF
jgi:aryl-alcohol dehydrogenase-like predicted oxidoreductase